MRSAPGLVRATPVLVAMTLLAFGCSSVSGAHPTPMARCDFPAPENLGPGINTPHVDDHPNISEDGLSLYFTSDRPRGSGEADLWVATRGNTSERFRSPFNLGPGANSASYDGEASISRDGLTMY